MELSNLRPTKGSNKSRKRIARGQGSGHGGTSTRGHKGDKARSGAKEKRAHEGGQTPMQRRLPKRGFKNVNRVEFAALNLGQLEALVQKTGKNAFDLVALVEAGVAKQADKIKLLGNGKIVSKVEITVNAASAAAKAAVEAAGGTVHIA